MKLTIGTARLQALLSKAIKGAGCNDVIPKTGLISIKLHEGELTLTTTDDTNWLTLIENGVSGDEFYVAVKVDLLTKLVSKMTCENVTLEVTDSSLEVSGNGKYQIALDIEDDGSLVKLTNPADNFKTGHKIGTVNNGTVRTILTSVKPALATDADESPWNINYYVGNNVTATDSYTVADYKGGFLSEPKLISPIVMDLLGLFSDSVIDVWADGDKMMFISDSGTLYSIIPDGIEHYSIEDINALVSQKFGFSCTVVKSALLNLLDRIALFVGIYDNGMITLVFGKDGLTVESRYATETIPYVKNDDSDEFVCKTDVATLVTQVKAQTGSEITIEYGEENAIKIIDGDITSVIALLTEED